MDIKTLIWPRMIDTISSGWSLVLYHEMEERTNDGLLSFDYGMMNVNGDGFQKNERMRTFTFEMRRRIFERILGYSLFTLFVQTIS